MTMSMDKGTVHQLELVPLVEGAWRLCDRSLDDDDPASVVAYVEQTARGVEVVWLHGKAGWATFERLSDVLTAAAVDLTPAPPPRSRRPFDIPHIAPKFPMN